MASQTEFFSAALDSVDPQVVLCHQTSQLASMVNSTPQTPLFMSRRHTRNSNFSSTCLQQRKKSSEKYILHRRVKLLDLKKTAQPSELLLLQQQQQ